MRLFSIGFTRKTAKEFFQRLKDAGVRRIVDVRLSNESQLARFSQAADLPYFLSQLCQADYHHEVGLAPTREIRDLVVVKGGRVIANWEKYEKRFNQLLHDRCAESDLLSGLKDGDCLLCSEHEAQFCHRRLVLEAFVDKMPHHTDDIWIEHLEPHGISDIRRRNWTGQALVIPKGTAKYAYKRPEVRHKSGATKGKWANCQGIAVVMPSNGAPKVLKSVEFHKQLRENALDNAQCIIWFRATRGNPGALPALHRHIVEYLQSGPEAYGKYRHSDAADKSAAILVEGAIQVLQDCKIRCGVPAKRLSHHYAPSGRAAGSAPPLC